MNRKTALVTGACINTGVAIVEKFASEGYNVIFTGRNAENNLRHYTGALTDIRLAKTEFYF